MAPSACHHCTESEGAPEPREVFLALSIPVLGHQSHKGILSPRARAAYRAFPRATLISLDETVTSAEIEPARIALTERMLQFFVDLGLSLDQAIVMRSGFLFDVFGFVLLVDYRYDRSGEATRRLMSQPVPEPWLDAHPDVPAPLSRRAAGLPPGTSDEGFQALIDARIALVEHLLEG